MKPVFSEKFRRQYRKLPENLRNKFSKQFRFVLVDYRHQSLRSKKMSGTGVFEARLDKHNRFIYQIIDNEIWFLAIGPHDTGLGKK